MEKCPKIPLSRYPCYKGKVEDRCTCGLVENLAGLVPAMRVEACLPQNSQCKGRQALNFLDFPVCRQAWFAPFLVKQKRRMPFIRCSKLAVPCGKISQLALHYRTAKEIQATIRAHTRVPGPLNLKAKVDRNYEQP